MHQTVNGCCYQHPVDARNQNSLPMTSEHDTTNKSKKHQYQKKHLGIPYTSPETVTDNGFFQATM